MATTPIALTPDQNADHTGESATDSAPRVRSPKPARRPTSARSAQMHGDETRAKIIAACIETLNTEGITGASARTIARIGEFNQALIFYHFGSVEGLIMTAAKVEGENRANRYRTAFENVTTLGELISVAREVHNEEQNKGNVNVLTQMLAGSAASPELQRGILDATSTWMVLVEQALERVLAGSSLTSLMPVKDMAFAISALFLGIELLTGLDNNDSQADELFDSIEKLSAPIQMLIASTR